ncbi:hypothetical protein ES706_05837 [subsurface metagenome]
MDTPKNGLKNRKINPPNTIEIMNVMISETGKKNIKKNIIIQQGIIRINLNLILICKRFFICHIINGSKKTTAIT